MGLWPTALTRTIHSFPIALRTEEPQRVTWWELFDFVLLIPLVQCWGGDSHGYCSLSLNSYSLLWSPSLSLLSGCHAAFSLQGLASKRKVKVLDVDSWVADSTQAEGPLVDVCMILCKHVYRYTYMCVSVIVHMLAQTPPALYSSRKAAASN